MTDQFHLYHKYYLDFVGSELTIAQFAHLTGFTVDHATKMIQMGKEYEKD